MLAIAVKSVIKLVAFLAVGAFVTFVMFPGPAHLLPTHGDTPRRRRR